MWEYRVVEDMPAMHEDALEERLNELGREGWELVAVHFREIGRAVTLYIFKRPVR
jgi:uncharacterized protein DUF4177